MSNFYTQKNTYELYTANTNDCDTPGKKIFREGSLYLPLGIHRCTIYDYIRHEERPLPFIRIHTDKRGIRVQGSDLLAYKAAGLPKKGRKFKDSTSR